MKFWNNKHPDDESGLKPYATRYAFFTLEAIVTPLWRHN